MGSFSKGVIPNASFPAAAGIFCASNQLSTKHNGSFGWDDVGDVLSAAYGGYNSAQTVSSLYITGRNLGSKVVGDGNIAHIRIVDKKLRAKVTMMAWGPGLNQALTPQNIVGAYASALSFGLKSPIKGGAAELSQGSLNVFEHGTGSFLYYNIASGSESDDGGAFWSTIFNYYGVFETFMEPGETRWSESDLGADLLGATFGRNCPNLGLWKIRPGRWASWFANSLY